MKSPKDKRIKTGRKSNKVKVQKKYQNKAWQESKTRKPADKYRMLHGQWAEEARTGGRTKGQVHKKTRKQRKTPGR